MHIGFHVLPPHLKKKEKSKGFPLYIQFPVIFQGPLKFVICDFLPHNCSCEHPIGAFNHTLYCHFVFVFFLCRFVLLLG